jgi:glycosyltransferase involved in cell wall biosynthesis
VLRELHNTGCYAHGVVVGGSAHGFSPGYEQQLRELITRLRLTEWVTMAGHVPDVRPLIAAMDVLVSASVMEPFGIVLLEGFVQAVPVVAVSDAGPREIVDHGRTGLLVGRPEPSVLAAAIRELLSDEHRRSRMALLARRTAVERFGVQVMTDGLARQLKAFAASREAA